MAQAMNRIVTPQFLPQLSMIGKNPTKIAFTLTHLSAVVTAATRQKMACNQGQALAALRSVLKYAYKKKGAQAEAV